eukprot:SAG31_NODE_24182_length_487_cov_0.935567_1_plen_136_part_00
MLASQTGCICQTDPTTRERAVSIEEYVQNLKAIIAVLRHELGCQRLVWCNTTPVDNYKHNVQYKQSWQRFNGDVVAYNAAASEVMRAHGVFEIDLYTYTCRQLGSAAGRDHGHMKEAASLAQAAYIAQAIVSMLR